MAKRPKRSHPAARTKPNSTANSSPTSSPTPTETDDALLFGERLRKLALGLTTALVVARAYWPGELITEQDSGQGLSWTFALLLVAILGVVSAFLKRSLQFRFSVVDGAILSLVLLVGLSTSEALDRRLAINLSWHWGGVAIAFVLLRQLPRTVMESRAVAAALCATAVAVSTYGLYQSEFELESLRRQFVENPQAVMQAAGVVAEPGSSEYQQFENRLLRSTEPFATFGLANSLAGYIVGPLVIGLGLLLSSFAIGKQSGPQSDLNAPKRLWWARLLAMIPIGIVGLTLMLTKSRSAFGAFCIGLLLLGLWLGPKIKLKVALIVGLAVLVLIVGVGGALYLRGDLDREVFTQTTLSLNYRIQYWEGTWRTLVGEDHLLDQYGLERPWLTGFGPGNFRAPYRRHKLVTSSEDIADPHNLVLEVWSTAGILGVLALGVAILSLFWSLFGRSKSEVETEASGASEESKARWLLVASGGGGWIAVILLGQLNLFQDADLYRWLILGLGWLLAVLCSKALWRSVSLSKTIVGGGILAILLNLMAAGGIGYPSIGSILWGLTAVGLNLRQHENQSQVFEFKGYWGPFLGSAVIAALIGSFFGAIGPHWRASRQLQSADRKLAEFASNPSRLRNEDLDAVAQSLESAIEADAFATRPYLAIAELEFLAWNLGGGRPGDRVWDRIESVLAEAKKWPGGNPLSLQIEQARVNFATRILNAHRASLLDRADLPIPVRLQLRMIIADANVRIADELTPKLPLAHALAAITLSDIGREKAAIPYGEHALELDSTTPHPDKKLPDGLRDLLNEQIPQWGEQSPTTSP